MDRKLSKSQYVRGVQCAKSLWLYRHAKELQGPVDPFTESIFRQGTEFGILAHQRFPGGVLIAQGHDDPDGALKATQEALAAGARILYEAAFLHDDVMVRVDMLVREADGWALIEVKSSTDVDEVYMRDVAIQRYVLAGAGFPVKKAAVMIANKAYERLGPLDLHQLFKVMDVTVPSEFEMEGIAERVAVLKRHATAEAAPAKAIGDHCAKPYECDFKNHCWAGVPAYSVFNIPYLNMDKKVDLYARGLRHVRDVDPGLERITDKRSLRPIMVARAGKPMIDRGAIAAFVGTIEYPVAHLDFETDNPVVPPYDGLRPYSQMPFQASLRVQAAPDAPELHHEFLGDGLTDPRGDLVAFLLDHLPTKGSLLAYHKSFEAGRLTELAASSGRAGAILDQHAERLQDLADPFRTGAYAHPDFNGRWSIKAVLPVLVPDLSYDGLEIRDGAMAMAAYAKIRDPKLPAAERARLRAALIVYCGQDTLAMVRILAHLRTVAAAAGVA